MDKKTTDLAFTLWRIYIKNGCISKTSYCHLKIDLFFEVKKYENKTPFLWFLFNGIFNLSTVENWSVLSASGAELFSGAGDKIDLSTYPKGVYLIKVKNQIERVIVK